MPAAQHPSAIRFGIAGVGRHGARYAKHLAEGDIPGARLQAIWRRDESAGRAMAARWSATYHPTLEGLLDDDDVEAVIMTVPSGLHRDWAPLVADRRKPLLLEKPIASSVAAGEEIIRAFERNDLPLTIAQTLRFDPLLNAARDAIAPLGRLVGFGFEQRLEPRGLPWEEDPVLAGGGVLAQTAIHAVDALRVLVGPTSVGVEHTRIGRMGYRANEDFATVILSLSGGLCPPDTSIVGNISTSKTGASRHHRYALFHREGGVEIDFIDRELIETTGRQRVRRNVPGQPTVPAVVSAFVRFLRGLAPNPVEPRDALASLRIIDDAYSAAGR